jgi:hypothetical protein
MSNGVYICAGHRPPRLGGYLERVYDRLTSFCIDKLRDRNIPDLYLYPTQGFNTCVARACIELNIPYHLIIPYLKFDERWDMVSKRLYAKILYNAETYEYVHKEPKWTSQREAERLVGDELSPESTLLLLWDGQEGGHTYRMKARAEAYNRKIENWWPEWVIDSKDLFH